MTPERAERQRPLRVPAPPVPPDAALQALEAFDEGAALVDLTHGSLAWCSPGFASRCCVQAGAPLQQLAAALPGLDVALAALAPPAAFVARSDAELMAPRTQWRLPGDGAASVGEAVLVRPGLAALRLRCAAAADADALAARRHLEDREKLLFTSRALAVGEMASTLAHELNQPIGTVANVLRGMRQRVERQAPADELLTGVQMALDQAQFAARIIARIREYTQSRQPRREPLDLAAVVQTAVALLDWEIRRDSVVVQLQIDATPCSIDGDEVMLQQLCVNLLRNALEAMRDNPPTTPGALQLQLRAERGMAVLTVCDNGCGLPADAALFVPFQSTKPNGMGIGLNICRSFVELHQGRLWFTPNAGRGASFHVALPLLAERISSMPRSTA